MRRPIRQLVALCLCWLAFWPQPLSQRDTPPVLDFGSAPVDWSVLREHMDQDARWFEWASRLPPPTTAQKPATIATRERIQSVVYPPGSIESIVCSVFADNCAHALAIARCESGLNPLAYNRSGASGLFQVMMPLHEDLFNRPEDVFDALENSRAAFTLSHGGTNWSPWVC